jgi:hypothetical protein
VANDDDDKFLHEIINVNFQPPTPEEEAAALARLVDLKPHRLRA